jgi:erythromycin esterase-like protein
MQFAGVAMNNVAEFVGRADPALMSTIVNNYGTVALVVNQPSGQPNASQVASATTAAKAVWQQLSANRAQYVQQQNPAAVDWAIQNAQIVLQCVAIQSAGDGTYRDAQMAANIEWIAAQNPGARIVLWAHDYHISRQPGSMGGALAEYFGSSYVTLGQFFHEGTYNAVNSQGLGPNAAEPSFSGSMEYAFHETRVPRQILNLHLANSSDPQSSWFFGTYWDRTIGAVAAPGFALDSLLASEFDAIVFFDQTDPSTLLSFPFAVTTLTLPTGAVGVGYFQDLVSTDSPGPTWTLTQGTLPPGLTLRAGGPLIGTPSASGTYNFAVSVGLGAAKAVAQLQITITD